MSKNIIMQQKTADGYEELYPKANGDGSVIVNNTTNQFLGGGSTVGDALGYLSKFGMYWWKKVYQKANWVINKTTRGLSQAPNSSYYFIAVPNISPNFPSSMYSNEKYYTYPVQCSYDLILSNSGELTLGTLMSGFRAVWYWDENEDGGRYHSTDVEILNNLPFYFKNGDNFYYVESGRDPELEKIRNQTTYNLLWDSTKIVKCVPYISSYTTTTTYICSSDPNAYPDQGNTDSSGAKYWKVGQPWEFLPKLGKVETGYYTGTGSGNVTLTFENAPQFVFISYKISTGGGHASCAWCKDLSQGPYWVTGSSTQANDVTQSGNSLTFTSMNKNAVAYQYFAITQ